jgi:hypothetical protein
MNICVSREANYIVSSLAKLSPIDLISIHLGFFVVAADA